MGPAGVPGAGAGDLTWLPPAKATFFARALSYELPPEKEIAMRNFSGKAPTLVVWVISLVLFLVALLSQFGVIRPGGDIATWSWIIGFGLLLIACRVRGL